MLALAVCSLKGLWGQFQRLGQEWGWGAQVDAGSGLSRRIPARESLPGRDPECPRSVCSGAVCGRSGLRGVDFPFAWPSMCSKEEGKFSFPSIPSHPSWDTLEEAAAQGGLSGAVSTPGASRGAAQEDWTVPKPQEGFMG